MSMILSSSVLRRATLLSLLTILAITGCKNPRAGDVFTLNSPTDVDGVELCIYPEGDDWIAVHAPHEKCTHPAELTPDSEIQAWDPHIYIAAISNLGERALQIYTLDTRSTIWLSALRAPEGVQCLAQEVEVRQPTRIGENWVVEQGQDHPCSSIAGTGIRSFDNDKGVPGNNGMLVEGQIGDNVTSHFAGIQWVATSSPASVVAIDILTGRKVAGLNGQQQQRLNFPIADIVSIQDGGWLVLANAEDDELVAYQPTFDCDGQTEEHIVGCELTVDLGPALHLPVTGSPRHLAASPQGDIYVSADLTPVITRYSLNDSECPPGNPCAIPLTFTCNDGIDNDGNGLIDAEDPSCYTPYMNEGEIFPDAQCADGIDNDGDGLIDAQDPKCLHRNYGAEDGSDISCTDGIDNDGDGRIDGDDPNCADGSEFPAGAGFTPPNGITIPRYERQPVYPGPISLTPDGDILIVTEGGGNRKQESAATDILFICGRPLQGDNLPDNLACNTPNTLMAMNDGDPARNKGVGIRLPVGVQQLLTASRSEILPIRNTDDIESSDDAVQPDRVRLLTRRVFAVGADSFVYSIDIDQNILFVQDDGSPKNDYQPLFRFTDANASYPDVRNMRLQRAERVPSIPGEFPTTEPGVDSFYPALKAIDPSQLENTQASNLRLHANNLNQPEAFIYLPREERYCFGHERIGCLTNPPRDSAFQPYAFSRSRTEVKDDSRVFDENWTLAWEGSLFIGQTGLEYSTQRTDALLVDNDGWIEFIGQNACDTVGGDSEKLCEMNIGWAVCPELEDLCERGADLCADNLDLCDICPNACLAESNLCAAGVQPGDIAIIPPLDPASYCRRGEEGCSNDNKPAKCMPGFGGDPREPGAYDLPIPAIATVGNEYRVVEVRGDAFRVEPLDFQDRLRYRLPSTLPSTDCYRRPFTVEIVAANNWTLNGARLVRTDTPYREIDGTCAYEVDVEDNLREWRPTAGERLLTRFGFEFEILEGDFLAYCRNEAPNPEECAHAMRGFSVSFTTEDNLTPRVLSSIVGAMGFGASSVQNLNLLTAQLLFVDIGTNELAVVNNDNNMRGTIVP